MNDCIALNNTSIKDKIADAKFDRYGNDNNFIGTSEITVTITLEEYRRLVKEVAVKDYEIDKYRTENNKLKNTITCLEQKISKLLTGEEENE